jgi:long-chain acyl-CoA synthetase
MKQTTSPILSIAEAYRGKTLLVTGVSGFLGKVWFSMFMKNVDDFAHVYVLIRGKGSQSAQDRMHGMLKDSYAFKPWLENSAAMREKFAQKVTVLQGDISLARLGIDAYTANQLYEQLDMVMNISGLVDFRPSLETAFNINVKGIENLATFVRACKRAKFLHVSTCYVAGKREGALEERLYDRTPNNQPLDPLKEIEWMQYAIAKTYETFNGKEKTQEISRMVQKRFESKNRTPNLKQFQRSVEQIRQREIAMELIRIGTDKAEALGWPNTYTYSKATAEALLNREFSDVDFCIVRPAIVECASQYPFAGWNEGFNTSGPLAYLMKGWFRHFPSEEDHPFDVVPVDYVAKGLMIAGALNLLGKAKSVYQISSSSVKPLSIGDAVTYISEYYQDYFRTHGQTMKQKYLSHRRTIASLRDHLFSSKNLLTIFTALEKQTEVIQDFPNSFQEFLKPLVKWISRSRRNMEQVEGLLSVFKPYIQDYVQIYLSKHIFEYEIKESWCQYDLQNLHWDDFWIKCQMPGLHKWCFPVIEGKPVELLNSDALVPKAYENTSTQSLSS